MKKKLQTILTILAMGCMVFFITGCVASKHVPGAERIDGGNYLFTSSGTALIKSPGGPKEIAQARVAAMALARAELVKKIKGVSVSESVSVEDLMMTKQAASTTAEGWLSRAIITIVPDHRNFEEGAVTAEGSLVLSPKDLEDMLRFVE
ncbi:MAG: hypothetical protein LAT58_10425 [Opitutales bacterium]|nr:hypothetical protein [Opitutales bacterium]